MAFKIKLSYVIILILVIIILLQRSCNNVNITPEVKIETDTVYKNVHDTIFRTATIIKKEYVHIDKPEYTSGETIDTCKARFQNLLKEYLTKNVYLDTIKIDSIGELVIQDTVWINKLYGKRKIFVDYKIPTITKTITKFEEPKRQLYVGLNGFANKDNVTIFSPGIIYKNKKDQIFQASIGLDFNGTITYGIGTYWKIKIK